MEHTKADTGWQYSLKEAVRQKMCACRLHDRMPVLLTSNEHAEAWLGTDPLSAKYVCWLVALMLVCCVLAAYCILTVHTHCNRGHEGSGRWKGYTEESVCCHRCLCLS